MTIVQTIFFTLCNTYLQSTSHVNRLFLTMYKTVAYKYHQPYLPSMFPECFTQNSQFWTCNQKEETLHKSILKNNNLQILVRIYSENATCLSVYLGTVAFNKSQLYIYRYTLMSISITLHPLSYSFMCNGRKQNSMLPSRKFRLTVCKAFHSLFFDNFDRSAAYHGIFFVQFGVLPLWVKWIPIILLNTLL